MPLSLQEMLMEAISGDEPEGDGGARKRGSRGNDYGVTLPTMGQLANLRELLSVYTDMKEDGCPFKVGDIVTPRPSSTIRGSGFPHVVIEVIKPELHFNATKAQSDIHFGQRVDIRIMCHVADETVASYWGESWQYMPFEEE